MADETSPAPPPALGTAAQSRFTEAFRHAPIGMAIADLDGRLLEVNAALCALVQRSAEELQALSWRDLTHPDDLAESDELLRELWCGEGNTLSVEKRYLRKDGSPVWVRVRSSVVRDASGTALYTVGHLEDITAQREAEGDLRAIFASANDRRRLERQLQQASKLEAVGRLAGGVAHDFNNMLLVVRGYSHLLLERLAAGDPGRAEAVEIDRTAERAARLVGQLLAFGRRQVLRPCVLDLNEVVMGTESLLRRVAGSAIVLRVCADRRLDAVRADPAQLEQVIVNLALNACDAMVAGGTLTVATGRCKLAGRTASAIGIAPGRYALLTVSDTGSGMDAYTAARACEPFFTTKGEGSGTGLGLSTVHGIVSQSGGGIAIESAPGRGTTVRVYLPLATAAPLAELAAANGARLSEAIGSHLR